MNLPDADEVVRIEHGFGAGSLLLDTTVVFRIIVLIHIPFFDPATSMPEVFHGASPQILPSNPLTRTSGSVRVGIAVCL